MTTRQVFRQTSLPISVFIIGVLAVTQLRDFSEGFIFLLASVGQFVAYVFVSRLRQRGSFFWHVVAAVGSNGMWYAVMHILKISDTYWLLLIPYLCGIISGRTAGVMLAQYVEKRYKLIADATCDSKLAPGQRLKYLMEKPTFWVLVLSLLCYLFYGHLTFESGMLSALYIVIGLGIMQNFFYALNTRASQRGNNWYIAVTGIMGGLTFYISATFLLSKDMPSALAVPYILSTVLGSATGAFLSMVIEWANNLRPDSHIVQDKSEHLPRAEGLFWKKSMPYAFLFVLGVFWITFQVPIFSYFGWAVSELLLPVVGLQFDLPRILIMLIAAVVFMLDSALHVIASRAGNRNHQGYHVSALIPKGSMDFLKISYLSLNSSIPDIVPIAVVSSSLGSLFGKDISQFIERALNAVMDVPSQEAKVKGKA